MDNKKVGVVDLVVRIQIWDVVLYATAMLLYGPSPIYRSGLTIEASPAIHTSNMTQPPSRLHQQQNYMQATRTPMPSSPSFSAIPSIDSRRSKLMQSLLSLLIHKLTLRHPFPHGSGGRPISSAHSLPTELFTRDSCDLHTTGNGHHQTIGIIRSRPLCRVSFSSAIKRKHKGNRDMTKRYLLMGKNITSYVPLFTLN